MTSLLSIITFLPIVAALILALFLRGEDEAAARNAKWLALAATTATFIVSCFVLVGLQPAGYRLPVRRRPRLDHGPALQDGRGRDFDPVRDADHVPDAAGDPVDVAGARPGQGIHDRLPGAGRADDRRVHRAGSGAVLPVLRGRADPDVPADRDLGRREPHLCVVQVLPVHLPRLGPDAGRDGRHVPHGGHHRHSDAADLRLPVRSGAACWAGRCWAARRCCCSWRSLPASRSRCRCGRSTPGCPTRTCRRRPPLRSCWPRCC